MYRKIEKELEMWKNRPARSPMLLIGARQTGKTYILREFGERAFESMMFFDLEKTPRVSDVFSDNLDPDEMIAQLEVLSGTRYEEGRTLIVLDEIQACPRALTSLKYFKECGRDIHVIGAGSLLGVALKRNDFSFPVGKVDTRHLYPLDFEEFLIACGKQMLRDACANAFIARRAVPKPVHDELLSLYRSYLVVGGMPEAVGRFIESGSYVEAGKVQAGIISDYRSDIAKYADDSQKVLAQRAFDTIPVQLAKENHKFQYNVIRKGATSAIFGSSIEWLCSAGITLRCCKVTIPDIPLKAYQDLSSFKLYMLDTGLLISLSGMPQEIVLLGFGERFMGGVSENLVAAALTANGIPLFYWESSGQAEIDFLIQGRTGIVPVEVKTGEHVRSRSLSVYRQRFSPRLSIRVSTRNFGFEDGIVSIPPYALWLLDEQSISML